MYYFKNLYECAFRLWKYILNNIAPPGAGIKVSLDFAAPVFSPDEVRAIMPVLGSRPGKFCPEYADITYFAGLKDAVKRERRQQMLQLVCLSRGALSPCCEQGAVANVTMWIDGVKRIVQMELP